MTEFGLECALQALSGVAESLHAAGFDGCLPSHGQPPASGEGGDDREP